MPDFKPMLSAKIDTETEATTLADLQRLQYPVICSPKVDGIRVVIDPNLGAVTRKLKVVPNRHIYTKLNPIYKTTARIFEGLDGEITYGTPEMVTAKDVFSRSTSAVMSFDGQPEFTYWVFDDFTFPNDPYQKRLNSARTRVDAINTSWVKALDYNTALGPSDVLELEESYLKRGFEGIMIRSPLTGYKYGRATLKQQQLIKLKRTEDGEATVINYEPLYLNQNEPTKDALGHQKRSSALAGKVATDMLGTLVCQPNAESGFTQHFEIGSGFDDSLRTRLWEERGTLIGRVVVFKYQAVGVKDKPRFPIFKGFRSD